MVESEVRQGNAHGRRKHRCIHPLAFDADTAPALEQQQVEFGTLMGSPVVGLVGSKGLEDFLDRVTFPRRADLRMEFQITPAADAEQFGRIMGRLGGESSLPLWAVWLAPSGWLRKSLQGSPARQVAAAAALGEIPSEKAGEILQEAADVSEGSPASEWINRAIARHGSA